MRGRQPLPLVWRETRTIADRRWAERSQLKLAAQFRPRWQSRIGVRVENLSSLGCCITGAGQLLVGTHSWIILPTLESRYARIAWCGGNAAGLDFAEPLHKSVTDMMVKRSVDASARW